MAVKPKNTDTPPDTLPEETKGTTAVLDAPEATSEIQGTPTPVDPEPEVPRPIKRSVTPAKIPLTTVPGKIIVKDEYGYHFENITIQHDVPAYVLAEAVIPRLPDRAVEDFSRANALLLKDVSEKKSPRAKSRNGIITYGKEKYTVPIIGREIFLRVILDKVNTDPDTKRLFGMEVEQVFVKKRLESTIKEVGG